MASSPTDPETIHKVTVYGWVKDPMLNPLPAEVVKFKINPVPQTSGAVAFDKSDYTVLTDDDGYFEIELAGRLAITMVIVACNLMVTGVLPPSGRISINDLEQQPIFS